MAETIVSSGEVGGFPDKCKPLDVFRATLAATLAKKIEEHVRDPLNGYHRKPWGGRYGYSPRLGWSVRVAAGDGFDGFYVRVEKIKAGEATGCDTPVFRDKFDRAALAHAIRVSRRMIRNHVKGPQQWNSPRSKSKTLTPSGAST